MGRKTLDSKLINFCIELKGQGLDNHQISKKVNAKFKTKHNSETIRKCLKKYTMPIIEFEKPKMPKILAIDIETKPLTAFVWGLWNNDVSLNMLGSDWSILSWCAKWVGEDHIYYQDLRGSKNINDDSKLLKQIWQLMDEADIILSQNGVRFDVPKLNSRFIINGMQPPSSFRQIDTKIMARKFGFTSNKLEYLTNKLCKKNKKSKHAKFSGFAMWDECMKGNKEAWKEMEEYNKMDVLSLEELYFKLAPWDNKINFSVYNDDDEPTCSCGSQSFKKSGFAYTNSSKFQKYKCTNCGREVRDKINLLDKHKRRNMKSNIQ